MSTKVKWAIIASLVTILLAMGISFFVLWSKGFTLVTYTTNNKVEDQLENILERENKGIYIDKVNLLGFKNTDDEYLAFFDVKDSETDEVFIVSYEKKGNMGSHKILKLNRIIKGDNSVVMMDTEKGFLILVGLDKKVYSGINILDKNTEKILNEINFDKEEEKSYITDKLNQQYNVMTYLPENNEKIKLELVKKSGN